ncbi:MAG: gliding motility-associated C-terminal domain-containing protein [Crocinitomicaceae bacterium]|nr:gliding motility-associated C-terminal domain-containing protein [Crocinitomicaceae bacterium]
MKIIITFLFLVSIFYSYSQGDNCATAFNLGTLPAPAGCSGGATGIGTPVTHNGTNVGSTSGNPYIALIDCGTGTADMASPALDVWYSFVASGPTVVIGFSNITGTFGTPQIGLYYGSCNSLTPAGCNVDGSPGSFTGVVTGQTYYIQVSGSSATGTGTFTISVQNNQECGDCLTQASLVATPPPVNGAYYPGQTVTFCYTIFTYNQVNTNWLHGVQLSYGAGWNMVSQTPPPGCDGNGNWSYIPSGSSNLPTGFGEGFYYNSSLGCANCNATNPEDNFGDANASSCDLQFCWTMQVDAACPASSLNLTVNTSGDGESGSWSNLSCQGDSPSTIDPIMTCCLPPTMSSTPTSCSNSSDGTATANATGTVSPWDFYWYNSSGTLIGSTMNTTATNVLSNIPTGTYTVVVVDNANCSVGSSVTVTSSPGATVTVPANISVCNGVTISGTNFTSIGFPSASYTWTNTNAAIGIPSSGTGNISSFTATNTGLTPITATITVTPYSGPDPATSCSGAPSSYSITVNPAPQVTLSAAPSTSICLGQSVTLTGSYTPQPVVTAQTFENNLYTAIANGNTPTLTNVSVISFGISPADLISNQIVSACFTIRHEDYTEFDTLQLNVGGTIYTSVGPAPATPAGQIYNSSLEALLLQILTTLQPPGPGNPPPTTATFCIPDALLTIIESSTIPSNATWTLGIIDGTGGADNGGFLEWEVIINDYPQLNYAWSSTDNGSITTTPLSSTTTGGDLTLNATPTTTTTYALSVTNEAGCTGTSNIVINVGNVTVSPPSSNPTLCANTPISPAITFTTAGATGIGAATNLPTGVTASYSNNTITVSGTPTNSGTFNYTIPVTGGCTALNATGTIIVNPINTVTAASSSPTICFGQSIPSITFLTSGATGIGSSIGLPTGVTASWFGNTITLIGTPSTSGVFNYSIPLLGGCGTVNAAGIITVVALPVITLTPDDPNTCNALDGSILVSGTGSGTITWSGPTSGNGSGPLNYTIPTLGAGTYSVSYVDNTGCQSTVVQTSLANPGAPQINIISDVTNCGTSYSLPAVPFVPGTQNNPLYYTGPNGTGTTVSVGTVYNAPTNITLYAYDVNGACSDEEPFTISINEIPSINPLSIVSGCPGSSINPTDFTSTPVGATFSWTNDNIAVGIASVGNGQIATYTAPANTTNTNVVGIISVTPTLNGCTGSISSFTITLLPTPTINAISNVSGCPGASADPADFVSVPAGATFTWSNSNASIGLATLGNNQITPFNLASNNTASAITGTISATATLNGCTSAPLTFTISINPTPVITLTPTDPSSCNGSDGTITVNTGAPGTVFWTGITTGTSGPMNANYSINNLSAGAFDVTFTNSSTGCQSTVVSTTLINPGAPILNPIADVSLCGSSYTLPLITGTSLINAQYYTQANGGGGIVSEGTLFEPDTVITLYAYDANGACTTTEPFTISLTSIPSITNPGTQTVCDSYTLGTFSGTNIFSPTYWTQTGGQGNQLNIGDVISTSTTVYIYDQNGACTGEESFQINIITTPSIVNPGDQNACQSYSLPTILGTNLSGSQAYFTNTQTSGGSVLSGPITSLQTVYIYDANGTCSDEESFTVTINSLPTLVSFTGGSTYCQGDVIEDVIATVNGTPDYTLYYSLDGVLQTPLTSSTENINLGNTEGVYVLLSLTDLNCSNSISSTAQTITINQIPDAPIAGTDTTYCYNATPIDLTVSGLGTYTWYDELGNILGNGSTFIPSMNLGTTVYNVSQTVNNCEGPFASVAIIVEECDIIIPTAFTPDNDQTNETWVLGNIDQIYPKNVVTIFNRWGNLIFQSKEGQYETNAWDGTYNNEKMPVGSYYFIIEFNDNVTSSKSGIVTLIKN